jgi:hypothetical protein
MTLRPGLQQLLCTALILLARWLVSEQQRWCGLSIQLNLESAYRREHVQTPSSCSSSGSHRVLVGTFEDVASVCFWTIQSSDEWRIPSMLSDTSVIAVCCLW